VNVTIGTYSNSEQLLEATNSMVTTTQSGARVYPMIVQISPEVLPGGSLATCTWMVFGTKKIVIADARYISERGEASIHLGSLPRTATDWEIAWGVTCPQADP
jgi:hypothetical protein